MLVPSLIHFSEEHGVVFVLLVLHGLCATLRWMSNLCYAMGFCVVRVCVCVCDSHNICCYAGLFVSEKIKYPSRFDF